jgi:uncharacterized membrane protein YagU involved in acid resistance
LTRNLWTRALWGGVIGTVVQDIILLLGRGAGWVKTNMLSSLARLFTTQGVSVTPSGQILGFVVHVLAGAILAIIFAAIIRALHSRHNLIGGLIFGLLMWLAWGALSAPTGLASAPWSLGTPTTLFTLAGSLVYGLVLGYAVSEEAIRERR